MQDVTIPALGMAMTEAVLTRWYKQPGESVVVGDILAEIETDKSNVELESPAEGVLSAHLYAEGAVVPVGEPVVHIFEAGEDETTAVPTSAEQPTAEPEPQLSVVAVADGPVISATARTPNALSPRQRRLAELSAHEATAPAATDTGGRKRAAIAARVAESWRTIPHFSVQREVDATEARAAFAELRGRVPDATYTDLLLRALGIALDSVVSSDGDVGLAVATPDGVMMPVVAKVATLDAASLVAARTDAVRRGREGRLSAHDLNSTALGSLSNLGSRGVDSFTGVVPLGQHVLLTVGRLAPRPVAVEDRIAVRPTVIATVNVDHRVMDGDQAADLLAAFDREFSGLRAWVQGDQA